MVQSVTYTHVDGNVIVYTANTAITSNHLIGNTIPGISIPALISNLSSRASYTITKDTTVNGVPNVPVTLYFLTLTNYVTDYGLYQWAKERLSSADFASFTAHVDSLTPETAKDDPTFKTWWNRYISDPNVKVQD